MRQAWLCAVLGLVLKSPVAIAQDKAPDPIQAKLRTTLEQTVAHVESARKQAKVRNLRDLLKETAKTLKEIPAPPVCTGETPGAEIERAMELLKRTQAGGPRETRKTQNEISEALSLLASIRPPDAWPDVDFSGAWEGYAYLINLEDTGLFFVMNLTQDRGLINGTFELRRSNNFIQSPHPVRISGRACRAGFSAKWSDGMAFAVSVSTLPESGSGTLLIPKGPIEPEELYYGRTLTVKMKRKR